jgi:hypothetical protein
MGDFLSQVPPPLKAQSGLIGVKHKFLCIETIRCIYRYYTLYLLIANGRKINKIGRTGGLPPSPDTQGRPSKPTTEATLICAPRGYTSWGFFLY